jgi:hypothetical protein
VFRCLDRCFCNPLVSFPHFHVLPTLGVREGLSWFVTEFSEHVNTLGFPSITPRRTLASSFVRTVLLDSVTFGFRPLQAEDDRRNTLLSDEVTRAVFSLER